MTTEIYSLTKDDKVTVTGHIRVGAAWDVSGRGKGGLLGKLARRAGGDLDAVAIMCQEGTPVRMAGIGNNDPLKDGSVLHSGDNQTGRGEGDDETIDLHLDRIKPNIDKIYLVVSAFKETNKRMDEAFQTSGFGGVENVSFNFYDMETSAAVPAFEIMPSLLGSENTCILAKLTRVGTSGNWELVKVQRMVKVAHGNSQALLTSVLNTR